MPFLTEPEPERGVPQVVGQGVTRLVARNPSPMTNHGTNSYLIADGDGLILLDPGPATDPQHVEGIVRAAAGRIHAIVVSHGHADHFGALDAVRARIDAPVYAYHTPMVAAIEPDVAVHDGDRIGDLTVLHTPGHAPDHICLAREDGLLFTADHVMAWSSSVVSLPNGDMRSYIESLTRLIERDDRIYMPGHGPALPDPKPYVTELLRRRVAREKEILAFVKRRPSSTVDICKSLYSKTDPVLQNAAERNIVAHLAKLQLEGEVCQDDEVWSVTCRR